MQLTFGSAQAAKMTTEHSVDTELQITQHHFGGHFFTPQVQAGPEYQQRIEGVLAGVHVKSVQHCFQTRGPRLQPKH